MSAFGVNILGIQHQIKQNTKFATLITFLFPSFRFFKNIIHTNRIIPKNKIEYHEKTIQIEADEMPISRDMTKDSGRICITATPGDKSCADEVGAGYHVIGPKKVGYKLWLQLTHSRVFVGCLDSQEHLDVELKRLTSSKLQQDIL